MKKKFFISTLTAFCVLCLLAGCEKQAIDDDIFDKECRMSTMPDFDPSSPPMALNCSVFSFIEGVSEHSKCGCYLIKGIALDVYEYGRNIRLVEDLKGNFPKNIETFIVWGDGNSFICSNRSDNLMMYEKQDVLIMLLAPAHNLPEEMIPPGHTWFEKPEDYVTITCTSSVLKLSEGNVTGHILPSDGSPHIDTMPWIEFQTRLNSSLINR